MTDGESKKMKLQTIVPVFFSACLGLSGGALSTAGSPSINKYQEQVLAINPELSGRQLTQTAVNLRTIDNIKKTSLGLAIGLFVGAGVAVNKAKPRNTKNRKNHQR